MKIFRVILAATAFFLYPAVQADDRQMVKMPEMMQEHMMNNMRDHVMAVHEILTALSEDRLDQAALVAEERLGMSSLDNHGASHMANFMPQQMGEIGTSMHKAASRFARTAEEGDHLTAYDQLNQITAACVACHAGYRIR
ncbi:MAG: hypothetical protein HOL04_01245 [Gammaproteobacteria bacterium]|jgi:hypothetical protein|nr:hypothetical protein [Gammaproteobacteria bacterium]MBT4606265.1 hypothetical protein [Thiotrichales bacterium]MBT3471196.1 hypothetical protein [Gammaproteobacteria bacterium]MBT3968608.1 hypothetical protein [Gammaproteobacteria bacterium]MBT4080317.1 hypothetical protein [Gammaproteobacteria bacterium]